MGKTQALFWIRETYHTCMFGPSRCLGPHCPLQAQILQRGLSGAGIPHLPASSHVFRERAASGGRIGDSDQEKHQTLRVKTFSESESVVFTLHGV